jgi:hypothetical protein
MSLEELEDIAPPIPHGPADLHVWATGAVGSFALYCAVRAATKLGVKFSG